MRRVPEPELMDDLTQAQAYAAADFSEPHAAFIQYFRERFAAHVPRRVLDLGCGPADVTLRFAAAFPECRVLGVDGAPTMITLARAAAAQAGLAARVAFEPLRLPAPLPPGAFDTVLSNSLLHHLADPAVLWQAIALAGAPGAAVLVMDLRRPSTTQAAQELVDTYAADAPAILRRDFLHSLHAAYTPEEIARQLKAARLAFTVEPVSDRHVLVHGRLVAG